MKYIHGDYGKGTWTYYGGHDPEDPQHAIGNPPTDLSLYKNSPGYRLILNNVLVPGREEEAAQDVRASEISGLMPLPRRPRIRPTRLSPTAAVAIRAAIRLAGGREVCFAARSTRGRRADGASRRARRLRERARAPRIRAARRDARPQPSVGHARAVESRPGRRRADPRRRHRLRDRQQRRRRSSTSSSKCRRAPSSERSAPTPIDRRSRVPTAAIARQHCRATRIVRASARWPSRSRGSTTTAASDCSRRARASANRSAISCRRCDGRRRTASARSCRRTRSTCRSSSSGRTCRFSSARSATSGALRAAQGLAQLSLPRAARAGASVGKRAVRGRRCSEELDAIRAWSERTRDGSLSDLTIAPRPEVWDEVAAEPDLCQRARCPAYEQVLPVQGAARSGAGGRDRRQSSSAAVRSRGAARLGQLGRGRGAAGVHASRRRRRASSRGRGGERTSASTVSRRSLQRLFNRLDRRGKGLLGALIARLATSDDLLSTASLDLVQHAARAGACTPCATKSALAVRSARDVSAGERRVGAAADRRFRRASDLARGPAPRARGHASARSSCSPTACSSCASDWRARSGPTTR